MNLLPLVDEVEVSIKSVFSSFSKEKFSLAMSGTDSSNQVQIAASNVHMRDPELVAAKRRTIARDGGANLQIITVNASS